MEKYYETRHGNMIDLQHITAVLTILESSSRQWETRRGEARRGEARRGEAEERRRTSLH